MENAFIRKIVCIFFPLSVKMADIIVLKDNSAVEIVGPINAARLYFVAMVYPIVVEPAAIAVILFITAAMENAVKLKCHIDIVKIK